MATVSQFRARSRSRTEGEREGPAFLDDLLSMAGSLANSRKEYAAAQLESLGRFRAPVRRGNARHRHGQGLRHDGGRQPGRACRLCRRERPYGHGLGCARIHRRHPLATFGGSIAAGLVITQIVQSRAQSLRSAAGARRARATAPKARGTAATPPATSRTTWNDKRFFPGQCLPPPIDCLHLEGPARAGSFFALCGVAAAPFGTKRACEALQTTSITTPLRISSARGDLESRPPNAQARRRDATAQPSRDQGTHRTRCRDGRGWAEAEVAMARAELVNSRARRSAPSPLRCSASRRCSARSWCSRRRALPSSSPMSTARALPR